MNNNTQCPLCLNHNIKLKYVVPPITIVKCHHCSLVFQNPVTSEEEIRRIYSSTEYFNRPYFNYCQSIVIQRFQQVLKQIEAFIPTKGKILDVGCATGVFLDIARANGWQPFGVEISDYATSYAREKFKLNIFAGEIIDARYPANYFDVITLQDVLEHVLDPKTFLIEINRVLKKDGLLYILTVNDDALINKVADLFYIISRGYLSFAVKKIYVPYHIYYFTKNTLKNLMRVTGNWKMLKIRQEDYPPERMDVSWITKIILKGFYTIQHTVKMKTNLSLFAAKE